MMREMFDRRSRVLVVLSAFLASAASAEDAGYTFFLDGKPLSPRVLSLNGDPAQPAPGDVVEIAEYWLVLGETGDVPLSGA